MNAINVIKKMFPSIESYGIDLTKVRETDEIRINEFGIRIGTFDMYGMLQGNGVRLYLDKDMIVFAQQGNFHNGLLVGSGMIYFVSSQTKYIGEFVNDVKSGIGKMIYANGKFYEGSWKNGHRNGVGKFVCPDGTTYEGFWVDGLPEGLGKLTYSDGRVKDGIFAEGALIDEII